MHRRRPDFRGFTLVEMLVVLGIILLVVSISLPAIMSARKSSQVGVGAAQMKSLNDMLINRAMERKGRFLTVESDAQTAANAAYFFGFDHWSRFTGEGFAAYWYSYLLATDPGGGLKVETAMSPADGEVLGTRAAGGDHGQKLFPASYYYSPTMFSSWHEYDFTTTSNKCCPSEYGAMYRGDCCDPMHNCAKVPCGIGVASLEEITFPDSKVILFDRADFMTPTRSQSDGGKGKDRPLPPAWNNPKAKPHVALADGSVSTVSVTGLTQKAAESMKNDPQLEMVPVDLFAVPDSMPIVPFHGTAVLDLNTTSTDGLYPYFFAGTRYGSRGRDLTPDSRK